MRRIDDKPEGIKLGIKDQIFENVGDKERLARFVKARVKVDAHGQESLAIIYRDPVEVCYEVTTDDFNNELSAGKFITFKMETKHEGSPDSQDEVWDKYINTGAYLIEELNGNGINTRFGIRDHIFASCNEEQRGRFKFAIVHALPDGKEIWDVHFKNVFDPWERMTNEEKIKNRNWRRRMNDKKIWDLVFNHDLKRWDLPEDFNYENVSLFLREKEDE